MQNYLTLTVLLALFLIGTVQATHLRSGEIHVKQEHINSYKVWITIIVYTNSKNTQVLFGGDDDILDFGDGSDPDGDGIIGILVPETANIERPDLGEGISMASFTVEHTYSTSGRFTLSYSEPNRNEGIINMAESVNTRFYVETRITLEPGVQFSTPETLTPPIFAGLIGHNISRSIACTHSSNQLLFNLVVPMRERGMQVADYKIPPNLSINEFTGELTWNIQDIHHPDIVTGEYAVAVRVIQMHDNRVVGFMIRDFQIILRDGEPEGAVIEDSNISETGRVYTPEGDSTNIKILAFGFLPEEDTIILYSDLAGTDAIQLETYDSSTSEGPIQLVNLTFRNQPSIVRDAPYFATVRIRFDELNVIDLNYIFYTNKNDPGPPPPVAVEKTNVKTEAYPNPSKKYVHLAIDNTLPAFVQIRNLQGQIINQFTSQGDVDVSDLTPGAYILTVQQKNQLSVVKVVKED